jgi:hypothetical protein
MFMGKSPGGNQRDPMVLTFFMHRIKTQTRRHAEKSQETEAEDF